MKRLRYTLLAVSLLFFSLAIQAQNHTFQITGSLVDADSGKAIDFADILLINTRDSSSNATLPDLQGNFHYEGIQPGSYRLMVRLIGYDIYAGERLEIREDSRIDLGKIRLIPLENGLAEVTVVAEKSQVVYKLDKKIIDASKNLLGSGGSAIDILENTPSVRVGIDGEVTFRGSSGFKVYVDGKPSIFTGTQALEQIPAQQIENIEIITTPSARHDTEGDVGLINIITKKNTTRGFSGMVSASVNTWLARRADFMLSQQNRKSRWFIGGQWSDRILKSDYEENYDAAEGGKTSRMNAAGDQEGNKLYRSLKAGWDLQLPKTQVEVTVEGGRGGRTHNGNLRYEQTVFLRDSLLSQETFDNINDFANKENFAVGSASVAHQFNDKGHGLEASLYYKYGGNALETSYNELNDLQGNRMDGMCYYEAEYRQTLRANLDYVLPFKEHGRLEAGYQYSAYMEDGDYSIDWWNPSTAQLEEDPAAYNTYLFKEHLHSVYAVVSGSWTHFEAQAGLRGEHTHTELNSSLPDASRKNNRFEVFPSAHLSYKFKHDQKLSAGYSYRTTRPQLWYMEPYVTYKDFFSAVIGNPDIRPEYIHSAELSYHIDFGEHSVTATAFYRNRRDKIERLRIPYKDGVTLDSMANVGRDYSSGLELSASFKPFKIWTATVNGNVYHYRIKNELAAEGREEASWNYDIMWNNSLALGKTTQLQLDACLVGPSVTTQGRSDTYWYANLAVRQQLFKKRFTAVLSMRDVFRSACYINQINTSILQSYTRIRPEFPQVMLTLSYSFNHFKSGSAREKEDRSEMFEGMNN